MRNKHKRKQKWNILEYRERGLRLLQLSTLLMIAECWSLESRPVSLVAILLSPNDSKSARNPTRQRSWRAY